MTKKSRNAILEATAKTLAWELYATAGYGRVRASVSVERFDRELFEAARHWRATVKNLERGRRSNGATQV